jgi:hypothetical protein
MPTLGCTHRRGDPLRPRLAAHVIMWARLAACWVSALAVGPPQRGWGSPSCGSTKWWWARQAGGGLTLPSCESTRWRWARSTFVSRRWVQSPLVRLDTLAVGSLRLRVGRHVGGGLPLPSCGLTRWWWACSALDALAVGIVMPVLGGLPASSCGVPNLGVGAFCVVVGSTCHYWVS